MNATEEKKEERGCYWLAADALDRLAEEFAEANRLHEIPTDCGCLPQATDRPGASAALPTPAQLRKSNRIFLEQHRAAAIPTPPRSTTSPQHGHRTLAALTVVFVVSSWICLRLFL